MTDPAISIPDLRGMHYADALFRMHMSLTPATYLEIGTDEGRTLSLAQCDSIAVDRRFAITNRVPLGEKRICALFQMDSDDFFAHHDPAAILGAPIDLAFLDGMHLCEFLLRDFTNVERFCKSGSIIAMHDCVPVEVSIAMRGLTKGRVEAHRSHWWTGDVWRTLLALQHFRPDLETIVLDAQPTGLVLVKNLDPSSRLLQDHYDKIVAWMMKQDLQAIGVDALHARLGVQSAEAFIASIQLRRRTDAGSL